MYEGWSKSSTSSLVFNFLVVNGNVLKNDMDIDWTFTYTQDNSWIDTFTRFLYSFGCKERLGPLETVKYTINVYNGLEALQGYTIRYITYDIFHH